MWWYTPSLAFRQLPPNSARTGYATEGALFISLRAFVHLRGGQRSSKGLGITKDSNHGNITKESKLTITKDGKLTIFDITKTVREACT